MKKFLSIPLFVFGCLMYLSGCNPEKNPAPAPVVPTELALSAAAVPVGSEITITGKGFSTVPAENKVTCNGQAITVTQATATSLTCTLLEALPLGPNTLRVEAKGVPADASLTVRIFGWKRVSTAPIKRRHPFSFTINNVFYVGAGVDFSTLNGEAFNDFWSYEPKSDKWTRLADFPGGKAMGSVAFVVNNKGYVGLGYEHKLTAGDYNVDFWQYDPADNTWTRVADFPGGERNATVAFALGDKGYVGTGNAYGTTTLQDFYAFDPARNTWTRVADFGGEPIYGATSFTTADKGYLVGGVINDTQRVNTCWEYDPRQNAWTRKADYPGAALTDGSGFSLAGRTFFGLGGITNTMPGAQLYEYDPQRNVWSEQPSFPGPLRFGKAWGSIGEIGLFGMGENRTMQEDLWAFLPR